jgi:hypothetical protein
MILSFEVNKNFGSKTENLPVFLEQAGQSTYASAPHQIGIRICCTGHPQGTIVGAPPKLTDG